MPDKKICVYGTTWCGDTARSRKCLSNLGINYIWYDIDKDARARAYVEEVNKGNRSVPTIVFPDGSILVEPSDAVLEAKCRS
jgi:mycoredoxin